MLSDPIGITHFAASITALITGTLVLAGLKGSQRHTQLGYIYCTAMLVVLVTSFMLYNLHGTFGILHWLAVISSLTLIGGMIPILLKYPKNNYLGFHFSFMYWSVIGLYCAFCAEVFTRIPVLFDVTQSTLSVFYALVGISTALVGGIGGMLFKRYKKKWLVLTENYQNSRAE